MTLHYGPRVVAYVYELVDGEVKAGPATASCCPDLGFNP
jgi:hypothetical protein